jgi:hypothetical protein
MPSNPPSVVPAREARDGLLLGLIRSWDRFWFQPSDPTTLAFIRVCCGLLSFYILLSYSWGLLAYVGPEAYIDREVASFILREIPNYAPSFTWSEALEPISNPALSRGNFNWSIYFHLEDPTWIVAVHVGFLLATALFALGLWTRLTGLIAWVAAMSYVQRANSTVFGVDTMLMIVLLYLQLGPSGAVLSLDRWLQKLRARWRGEPVPAVEPSASANFAIRLLQVHFCIVYFASGTSKLLGSMWWAGTALNLVLLNPAYAPLDWDLYYNTMRFLASYRPLWEIFVTAGIVYTLMLEIGFPFLVWDPRWRWLMISCSVLLHLSIGLFMGLTIFSLMMIIFVSSFIPSEVFARLFGTLSEWGDRLLGKAAQSAPTNQEMVLSR